MFKTQSLFSGISLIMGFLAFVLCMIIMSSIRGEIKAGEGFGRPPLILIYFIYLFLITGLILSMMGFKRNEKPAILKWSAFILNLLLLFVIVAAIIFSITTDT